MPAGTAEFRPISALTLIATAAMLDGKPATAAGQAIDLDLGARHVTAPHLRQLAGGERYDGQTDTNLHLIEKTKSEQRLKIAFNF